MFKRKFVLLSIFAFITLILAIETSFSPWWEVSTSKRYEILNNTIIKVEYVLSGNIKATKVCQGRQTVHLTVNKWELTLKKVYMVTEKNITNLSMPSYNFSNATLPTDINFGTYNATFIGNANVTERTYSEYSLKVWLNGSLLIEDYEMPFNVIYNISTPTKFPGDYLKTWLNASGNTFVTIKPIITSINYLDSNVNNKTGLSSFFQLLFYLTLTGSGLNILIFLLTILPFLPIIKRNFPYKLIRYIIVASTLIFLISFIYFIAVGPSLISRLNNVTPPQIYELKGSSIKSLYGNMHKLFYGPAYGFYFAIATSLMNIGFYTLIKKTEKLE